MTLAARFPDSTPADHWWCADCGQWGLVDDADLCPVCADEHGLARLVDLVLETDQLAYRLEEAHWRSWHRLTADRDVAIVDTGEAVYHAESQLALSAWLACREQQRYSIGDLHLAGGGWGRRV